jgi:hypothetical protein
MVIVSPVYFEGTTIAAMCYQTLSHANTYDKMYTQWICLLPAVDVARRLKTIQFTVICVMITIVQKIVILKSMLDLGRSFSDPASSYVKKNTLNIFLKSVGLNSLSFVRIPVVQIIILIDLSFNFDWELEKILFRCYTCHYYFSTLAHNDFFVSTISFNAVV